MIGGRGGARRQKCQELFEAPGVQIDRGSLVPLGTGLDPEPHEPLHHELPATVTKDP
jgi:hypothetical protein